MLSLVETCKGRARLTLPGQAGERFVVAAGIFWLVLLLVLTLSDVLTRDWFDRPVLVVCQI
jgi:hypothetical protein